MNAHLWLLGICITTLALVIFITWLLLKHDAPVDRSIDAAREQLHTAAENNDLAHEDIKGELVRARGKLQFLIARTIAEELAAQKKAEREKP